MKAGKILYIEKEEFEKLKNRKGEARYYESKKYKKLRVSKNKEIRCEK